MPYLAGHDALRYWLMITTWLIWSLIGGLAAESFVLRDGTVYRNLEGGRQKVIFASKKCIDLWVAPDQSVVMFAAVDESGQNGSANPDPMILRSSIYLARKAEGYRPVRVIRRSFTVEGRRWRVLRRPRPSPDHKTMYFEIPFTMTTSRLFSTAMGSSEFRDLGNITDYCVVWGGKLDGKVMLQKRFLPDPEHGIVYQCFLRDGSGISTLISENCEDLTSFVRQWGRAERGRCE